MSLDVARLERALDAHGAVARVVVIEARGSAPREAGTEMLVWADGFDGTIGGGALEWRALALARAVLEAGAPRVERMSLGPSLGQCCGGAVTLAIERLDAVPGLPWVRWIEGAEGPFAQDGRIREEVARPGRAVWIWGAGHVGRALAGVLEPLPDFTVTMVDEPARLPDAWAGATLLASADMPQAMRHAPLHAEHLILTYSHSIDLALCHAALTRGFGCCGLIGSATKWARFRSRLAALGHDATAIDQITCPIGDPALGKHPQAIAVGVASWLLSPQMQNRFSSRP
ncbi:xanthine dehydrogenase accessory protein XdhC [Jannaschia sp. S6380]|uniref:xanthine dehydrogenase accessory protein XdhC n=1 Tax=Jannaschia sp. S6380 TaxID=2926408 RepID=UPI001FF5F472|nr:xanthine dehydrogenase accessory protein XdhC [Jannaschia sp. S6380]MCK0168927.1 xanthine dehydrogenase accessory protein XdhC [Jannaschia sp. S6380]